MNESTQTTVLHRLAARAESHGGMAALRQKRYGIWHVVAWGDYWRMVGECALGMGAIGIAPGERIAILSANRQEWAISHLGIGLAGAVPIGLYAATTTENLAEQLRVVQPVAIFCEDQEQLDKILAARGGLTSLRTLVVFDMRGIAAAPDVSSFDALMRIGAGRVQGNPTAPSALLKKITSADLALVTLSNGTTGGRKAIDLVHGNINALLDSLLSAVRFDHTDEVLSSLPLAHPTEQMFSLFMPIAVGATVNFPESSRSMQDDIREIAPTVFVAVPRVWEGLYREIMVRRGQTGGLRRRLFDWALAAAGRGERRPHSQWTVMERLQAGLRHFVILRELQDFTGLSRARFLASTGAVTSPEALDFFRKIGLPLRNVYSLAEAGGPVAIGEADARSDTISAMLPALEGRVGFGGMLELRRKPLQSGPQGDGSNGWFESGDIVEQCDGGLRLLGRSADRIDTPHGPIHPSVIENLLKTNFFIREALAVPESGRGLTALVQIDFATVGEWAKSQRVSFTTFTSLACNAVVADLIAGVVRELNLALPVGQRIASFVLLHHELDAGQDELTPLLTVRRSTVRARHALRLATAISV